MAWEEVGGFTRFVKCKDCAMDEVLVEGKYQGKAENQYGEYHRFRSLSGEYVGIRGGHLDYLLENVKHHTTVKVVYQGAHILDEGPFKGKETHRFKVFMDSSSVASDKDFDMSEIDFDKLGEL